MAKKKARRRWYRRVGLALLFVAALPLCVLGLAKTGWARRHARELAVRAIHDELGLTARIGDVNLELLPPTVVARDITLDDPVYGRLATARGLRITPSLVAIASGRLDLDSIELEQPQVRLVVRDGEIRNLPRPPEEGGESHLPFTDLSIDDGTILVDAAPLGSLEARGVDADLTVLPGEVIELSSRTSDVRVHHARGEERITRLEARARLAPHDLEVHELVLETAWLSLAVHHARTPLPLGDDASGRVDLNVDLAHVALLPLPPGLDLPRLEGRVEVHTGTLAWHRATRGVDGTARVLAHDILVKKFRTGEVALDLSVTPTQLAITRGTLDVERHGGRCVFHGTLGLHDDLPVDAQVDIHGLEFGALMAQLGVSDGSLVAWKMEAQTHVHGHALPLAIEGPMHLQTRDFLVTSGAYTDVPRQRVVGVETARFETHLAFRPDGVHFERIDAQLPRTHIQGDVLLGFDDDLRVHARSDHMDVRDASPLLAFPTEGIGTATVEIGGKFNAPTVHGTVALRGFVFDHKPLGDVHADEWHLEEGGELARFRELAGEMRSSRYRVEDFVLDFTEGRFLMGGLVHLDGLALADFYEMIGDAGDERFTPYQGLVRGQSAVRFTSGFPGDAPGGTLVAGLDLHLPTATMNGYAFDEGRITGEYRWLHREQGARGAELDITAAELRKGEGTLTASGTMRLGGVLDFDAVIDRLSLRDTEGIGDRFDELGGTAGLVAHVGGTLSRMRADVDVQLTGLAWRGTPLGDGRAYVRLTDQSDPWVAQAASWSTEDPPPDEPCAHARAGFAHGRWPEDPPLHTSEGLVPALDQPMAFLVCGEGLGGRVTLDVAVGRTRVYPLRGLISLAGVDIAPFVPDGSPLEGELTARVDLTGGAMLDASALSGRVRVSDLRFGTRQVEVRNDGLVDVRLFGGRYQFVQAALTGPSSRVTLSGGGSFDELATTVDGEIDLGVLSGLTTQVTDTHGTLALRVRLSGRPQSPSVFGEATLDGGSFRVAGIDEPFEDLGARVTFSERSIAVEELHARVAGGAVTAHGEATLDGRRLGSYEVHVSADELSLRPSEGIEATVGGDLALSWARGDRVPTLRGDVHLDRVTYERPIELGQTLAELARSTRTEVEEYDPDEDRVALDVRVRSTGAIHVDNNLADVELVIDDTDRPFRIVGTDQRPGVLGKISVRRGAVRFRSTTFDVQHGEVDFDDEARIDPRFDLRAQTILRRGGDVAVPLWRIYLHAYGNRDAFHLDTNSDPDLSQEDIVLLLTVGMTRAEAQQLQAGTLGQTAALEALATVTGVDREVRNALPVIDDFRFSSAYSVRTGRTEPTVSVGKRISDRIRLSATTSLGEYRDFRAALEWRLDDHTSVQGGYDNLTGTSTSIGNVGVDLRWRLEFE